MPVSECSDSIAVLKIVHQFGYLHFINPSRCAGADVKRKSASAREELAQSRRVGGSNLRRFCVEGPVHLQTKGSKKSKNEFREM
jgi:hypothetical protein